MKTNRIEVPLIFLKNNHFGIIAKINNKEACLLIDTGAGISIIHTKQVEYLGLKTDEGNIEVVVKGIGTSAHSSKNIIMSSMIIGRAEYKKPLFIDIDLPYSRGC